MPPSLQGEPLGLQLARAAKAVSRAFDDVLVEAGGSLPTWLVLVSVKSGQPGMQRELAAAVGIEGPTLTHHLNRMESAGLVTRTRDPLNRRIHRVEVTAAGEATFHRLLQAVVAFDRRLRDGVSDEEAAVLGQLLGRLRANVAVPPVAEASAPPGTIGKKGGS